MHNVENIIYYNGKFNMSIASKTNSIPEENTFGKLKILIADESLKGHNLSDSLNQFGFITRTVSSVDEIGYILNLEKFDIVIVDYNFKNNRAVQEIKKMKFKSRNTKVKFLVTSVQNEKNIKENSFLNQCDHFLVKPIPLPDMIQELKKLAKQEYRKSERMRCHIAFSVTKDQNNFNTTATDISPDGVHLLDNNKKINFEVGSEIHLEFKLPKTQEIIKCQGIVVRISQVGFGIKFHSISDKDKNLIKVGVI